jgi:hypothetical protein
MKIPGGTEHVYMDSDMRTALWEEAERTGKARNRILIERLREWYELKRQVEILQYQIEKEKGR